LQYVGAEAVTDLDGHLDLGCLAAGQMAARRSRLEPVQIGSAVLPQRTAFLIASSTTVAEMPESSVIP
jgi:hypothetical protein